MQRGQVEVSYGCRGELAYQIERTTLAGRGVEWGSVLRAPGSSMSDMCENRSMCLEKLAERIGKANCD